MDGRTIEPRTLQRALLEIPWTAKGSIEMTTQVFQPKVDAPFDSGKGGAIKVDDKKKPGTKTAIATDGMASQPAV